MKFAYVVGFLFFIHIFSISNAGGGRKKSKGKDKKEVHNINPQRSSRRREERKEVRNINAEGSSSRLHEMQEPEEDTRSLEQSQDVWGPDEDEFTRGLRLYREKNPEVVKAAKITLSTWDENRELFELGRNLTKMFQDERDVVFEQRYNELMNKFSCAEFVLDTHQQIMARHSDSIQESQTQLANEEWDHNLQHCEVSLSPKDQEFIRSLEQSVASIEQKYGKYKQEYEENKQSDEEFIRLWQSSNWLGASSSQNEETKESNSDSEK